MKAPPAPTAVERTAGSVPIEAAAAVVAALAGGPLAAILPVLTKSLASERQRARVEQYLVDVSLMLQSHEERLRKLSDAQYKLINDAILASLQTTQAEKLEILRAAVKHALDMTEVEPQEAILLSRIVRDISAEEAGFVVRNFSYTGVHLSVRGASSEDGILAVDPNSRDALIVSALLSLGVLTPGQPTLGQILGFSSIAAKLIVLLKGRDA